MVESSAVIRHIEWRELFPWLILFRTFRLAISPTVLALATAAVLLAPLGWHLAARAFLTSAERSDRAATGQLIPQAANSQLADHVPPAPRSFFPSARTAILEAYFDIAEPLKRFFQLNITLREAAYYAFGFLWTLALWTLPGAYITRRALVQFATDAPPSVMSTFHFATRRYHWYFLAPLYPLLGVVLLATPIALMGLLLRASIGVGVIVAGLLWLFVVLLSLAAMWLLVGLLLGWPLMWPTISAERDGDPFEAFSRSYSYVYGKPLRYFFYVVIAAIFGALCWAAVEVAARIVQEFGFWALSWGGGRNTVAAIREQALDVARGEFDWVRKDRAWSMGTTLIGLMLMLIQAAATAFRFSYFFAAASAMYLLLRHDVDEKELDEVYAETDSASTITGDRTSQPRDNQSSQPRSGDMT